MSLLSMQKLSILKVEMFLPTMSYFAHAKLRSDLFLRKVRKIRGSEVISFSTTLESITLDILISSMYLP